MSTSLSIKAIKAEHNACEYSASTRLSENHLEHKTHYPHGHDELDTMCEQLELQVAPSNRIADWAILIAMKAIMHYYACKELVTNSWHSLKKKIARR